MTTFSHSGQLGDIIWSLPTIRHLGGGDLYVTLNNVANIITKYKNGPIINIDKQYLLQCDVDNLTPLLIAQKYINSVNTNNDAILIDYNLDLFRQTVGESFKTNFLVTYANTFNHPVSYTPWLEVSPLRVASCVVSRSLRYHSERTRTIPTWISLLRQNNAINGVFVGTPKEHSEFVKLFNINIKFYNCSDILELARIIAGADVLLCNQSLSYSIAKGLGKVTILETMPDKPLQENECFLPIDDSYYF